MALLLFENTVARTPAARDASSGTSPTGAPMMKPIDQHLADLSVRAKKAEADISAAKQETRERIVARREQFRTDAVDAASQVDQDLRAAGVALGEQWANVRDKVVDDISRLKSNIAERQVERSIDRLADRADRKETDANVAIDFALASIANAKLAVIDAVLARRDAEEARS